MRRNTKRILLAHVLALLGMGGVVGWTSALAQTPVRFNSSGTAFFVSPDGLLLTSNHVVKDKTKIAILMDGRLHEARIVKQDAENDLAVLKIEKSPVPYLRLSRSENVPVGLEVFTLGYPQLNVQGMGQKFSMGLINSDTGMRGSKRHFQFSAQIQRGNSGGPLLAPDGLVVGVVESKLGTLSAPSGTDAKAAVDLPQNVNYALKSSFAVELLRDLPSVPEPLSINPRGEKRPFEVYRDARYAVVPVLALSSSSPPPSSDNAPPE